MRSGARIEDLPEAKTTQYHEDGNDDDEEDNQCSKGIYVVFLVVCHFLLL